MSLFKLPPGGSVFGTRIVDVRDLSRDEKRAFRQMRRLAGSPPGSHPKNSLPWDQATEKITLIAAIRGRSAREITEALVMVRIGDWDALEAAAVPLLKKGCRR